MIEVTNIKVLGKLPREPENGEIALCTNSDQKYIYHKDINDWIPYKPMTKYDYEAGLAAQWKPYTEKEKEQAAEYIDNTFDDAFIKDKFFILIGIADFKYLTIFVYDDLNPTGLGLGAKVIEAIENIGSMLSCNYENEAIKIWVKGEKGPIQLLLLNYRDGVEVL